MSSNGGMRRHHNVTQWGADRGGVTYLVKRVADDSWAAGALESSDPSKDAALESLKKLSPDKAEEALLAAMKSRNAKVRAWATRMLGEDK